MEETTGLSRLLVDAKAHLNEASNKIEEWNLKYDERLRHLSTIEAIISETNNKK